MPFGDYSPKNCRNPECQKRFKPVTPWQEGCCEACRNRCTYIRTTLPKRLKEAETRLAGLRRRQADPERVRRMEARIAGQRKKVHALMGQMEG